MKVRLSVQSILYYLRLRWDKSMKSLIDNGEFVNKIILFLKDNPTEEEIERFYVNEVLPHDNRSINEIITDYLQEGLEICQVLLD